MDRIQKINKSFVPETKESVCLHLYFYMYCITFVIDIMGSIEHQIYKYGLWIIIWFSIYYIVRLGDMSHCTCIGPN